LNTRERFWRSVSSRLPKLTLRRALTIPIAYALVFGLFRAVNGPPTPDVVVYGLIGGTGLAGIGLLARTRGQWIGAIAGLLGGVLSIFCCAPFTRGIPDDVFAAAIVGFIVALAVRRAVDGPRPFEPDEPGQDEGHDLAVHRDETES
jgi:hypothetical protein